MAQVNSEPGKNQVFSTAAVTAQLTTQSNPGAPSPGNQYATSVTVPYAQSEAGAPTGGSRPVRS